MKLLKQKKYYVIASKVTHFQPSNLLTLSYQVMKQRKCMSEESFQRGLEKLKFEKIMPLL